MTSNYYLPPRILQGVGLLLLVAFAVFWAVTGRESALLVGAAGSLVLLGRYEGVVNILTKPVTGSPPPIAKDER